MLFKIREVRDFFLTSFNIRKDIFDLFNFLSLHQHRMNLKKLSQYGEGYFQ